MDQCQQHRRPMFVCVCVSKLLWNMINDKMYSTVLPGYCYYKRLYLPICIDNDKFNKELSQRQVVHQISFPCHRFWSKRHLSKSPCLCSLPSAAPLWRPGTSSTTQTASCATTAASTWSNEATSSSRKICTVRPMPWHASSPQKAMTLWRCTPTPR